MSRAWGWPSRRPEAKAARIQRLADLTFRQHVAKVVLTQQLMEARAALADLVEWTDDVLEAAGHKDVTLTPDALTDVRTAFDRAHAALTRPEKETDT